jgi:preprotein translocase subunit YajC
MLISMAYAQDAGGGGGSGLLVQIAPLILIFAVFYFLLIRPQQQKAKRHRELVAGLQRGDKVITGGGLYATVVKVEDDNTVILEIAQGVRVKSARHTITDLAAKPEPRKGGGGKDSGGKGGGDKGGGDKGGGDKGGGGKGGGDKGGDKK